MIYNLFYFSDDPDIYEYAIDDEGNVQLYSEEEFP